MNYDIENTKMEFYDMPEELVDHLSSLVMPYLSPLGFENATKGLMTPLDWKNKMEELNQILR